VIDTPCNKSKASATSLSLCLSAKFSFSRMIFAHSRMVALSARVSGLHKRTRVISSSMVYKKKYIHLYYLFHGGIIISFCARLSRLSFSSMANFISSLTCIMASVILVLSSCVKGRQVIRPTRVLSDSIVYTRICDHIHRYQ